MANDDSLSTIMNYEKDCGGHIHVENKINIITIPEVDNIS